VVFSLNKPYSRLNLELSHQPEVTGFMTHDTAILKDGLIFKESHSLLQKGYGVDLL